MKTLFSALLLVLMLFAAGAVEGQQTTGLLEDNTIFIPPQLELADAGSVTGEAIIAFESPQSAYQRRALRRNHSIIVKEWSPSGKYALISTINFNTNQPCGYDGDGNPFGFGRGGGDGSLNYIAGTDYYDDSRDCSRVQAITSPNGLILLTADYSDYSPTNGCQDPDQIEPNWQQTPFGRWGTAKVAIIDSGIKGLGGSGTVNGVSVSQKVVPLSCSSSVCNSYSPSVVESKDFNSHGRSIASLITGWFRALNLTNRLEITSYKVLDNNLKGSVFQVIKAIEEATTDGNHIISLSLGFVAQNCGSGATVLPDFPNIPGTRDFIRRSPLYYAIKDAEDAGVIVITSAGNDGNSLDDNPQYPAAEEGLHNLVTVGALNCGGVKPTHFSNFSSEHVDLFTSGEDIRIIDNLCTREVSGTSFACPIVSAKAALHVMMRARGGYNYLDVLCQLRGESTPYPGAKYGIVDSGAPFQSDCNRTNYPKSLGKSFESPSGEKTEDVVISPNPFKDQLRVDIPDGEALLTIIDARGARVMQQEIYQSGISLDLRGLKPGVYWVNVHSATGTQTKSVVKQ